MFFPTWVEAFTLGSHIFYRGDSPSQRLVRHETCHVRQYRKHGAVKFLLLYFYYNLRYGYQANPFEIEARQEE